MTILQILSFATNYRTTTCSHSWLNPYRGVRLDVSTSKTIRSHIACTPLRRPRHLVTALKPTSWPVHLQLKFPGNEVLSHLKHGLLARVKRHDDAQTQSVLHQKKRFQQVNGLVEAAVAEGLPHLP